MKNLNVNLSLALVSVLISGLTAVEAGLRKGDGLHFLVLAFVIQSLITLKAAYSPVPGGTLTVEAILGALQTNPVLRAALVAALAMPRAEEPKE